MKKLQTNKWILGATAVALIFASCNKEEEMPPEEPTTQKIMVNTSGLEDLGSDFVYEGWLIVDDSPVSTGTFTVDADGEQSKKEFEVKISDANSATKFVLSIEPENDSDPAPAATKILAGDFSGSSAELTIAPVGDFSNAAGKYILATPTNGADTDENSGIWFLDLSNGAPPTAGLTLPELPDGWKYEGWTVIGGVPVTTGKFTKMAATDEDDPYSGPDPLGDVNGDDGFFPGEDFLENAPDGLTFPTDIAGGTAVISIEPNPDNNAGPFTLKPLVHGIDAMATDHLTYIMDQNLNFPTGTVSK
jgi:hypothetical protein